MAAEKHAFLKNGSDLFLRGALERGDHVEAVRENHVLARMLFGRLAPLTSDALIKIDQLICPTPVSADVLAMNSSLLPLWEKVARSAG